MRTIAFYNLKGGVGKTAAAVNIAYLAAQSGLPTLFWDLDPQAAASFYLQVQPGLESKPKKLLKGKAPVGKQVRRTAYPDLDMIPADWAFRDMDLMLSKAKSPEEVLEGLIEPFSETYALLVLDCPPSFSRLSENVFDAADALFVPVIPSPLSLRAYEQVRKYFKAEKLKRKRLHPFFSMVDRRRKLHKEWTERPPAPFKDVMRTAIPYASTVEQMGEYQAPIDTFAPRSRVNLAYRALWHEVQERARIG